MKSFFAILATVLLLIPQATFTQSIKSDDKEKDTTAALFNGLKFRSIGPALMSGRVIDFAVNPTNAKNLIIGVNEGVGIFGNPSVDSVWVSQP